MDISFDIQNYKGDQVRVALSYYDAEALSYFTTNPSTLSLIFYDVTLLRMNGNGYVGYNILSAVSDTLARFMAENEDAVLCFYCDSATDVRRNHSNLSPQEYRSRLFSKMFDLYTSIHKDLDLINHQVKIEDSENYLKSQFAHFICKKNHESAVTEMGKLLMEK